jgi:hypothetical protein
VPRSVHVGFVVDKVTLGQVFLQVLQFSCLSGLQTHIYNLGMNNMPAGGHSSDTNVSLKVKFSLLFHICISYMNYLVFQYHRYFLPTEMGG